jgi:DNA-binding beta-propeller fold protein YncE
LRYAPLQSQLARSAKLKLIFVSALDFVAIFAATAFLAFAAQSCALAAPRTVAASASVYHLVKKINLGGSGGWDYLTVDAPGHRVFISRSTHVIVVDLDQLKIVGDIPGTDGVHGIALAPDLHRGFTSDGRANMVTIFDLTTLATLGTVPTGEDPDAIVFDPFTKRVFTMNGDSSTSTAIDAGSGKVVGTIALGGRPEFTVSDGKGQVFANLEDKSELVRIDPQTLRVENTWPLAPCESPSGLAIDAEHEILIVGCHNQLMTFVDGRNGKILGTVPIGQGVDANRFDAATGLAFASCGDGTLTIAHEDAAGKFSLVEKLETQRGARTMALDLSTHEIFLVTAEFGPAPAPTAEHPRPRPAILPGTFTLLVYAK